MEPGLGTNPRSSGNGVGKGADPLPDDPGYRGAASEEERAKSESSPRRPAGLNQWLAQKTPIGLAESLLPRVGGWVCELQRRTGARACYSQWLSPSPPPQVGGGGEPPYLTACPRVQRLRHYVAILSVPPNPGLTFVNPPGRCTRGLTGHEPQAGGSLPRYTTRREKRQ
jgi:hypothetical protein